MATDPIEMIPVYMPDPTALIGPLAEYQFQSATETTYKMVPVNFRKSFDSCGYKSKTDPPTAAEVTQVQDVSSAGTSLFANYGATVSQLKTDWQALLNADVAVLQNVRQSSTIS